MTHASFSFALGIVLLLLSCSYNTAEPSFPPALPEEVSPISCSHNINLGIGQERKLKIPKGSPERESIEYVWESDGGYIVSQEGSSIVYKAPEYAGKIKVSCLLKERGKIISSHNFLVTAYHQVVVLKADDLVYVPGTIFPANWNKYFELLDSMKIKGTAGIIGNSLENAPQAYYDKIKFYYKKGFVEFWNHGYTHELSGRNSKGEVYHEFFNRDIQAQEKNLLRTQELGREKLGITFRSFGAPGNGIDANTRLLIDRNEDIRMWFYGDENSVKNILRRTPGCEIEFPVHHPSFSKFSVNYKNNVPFLTLQFHPTRWSHQEFNEFRQILIYLQDKHVAFMNPLEFAETFFPELVQDIQEVQSIL